MIYEDPPLLFLACAALDGVGGGFGVVLGDGSLFPAGTKLSWASIVNWEWWG